MLNSEDTSAVSSSPSTLLAENVSASCNVAQTRRRRRGGGSELGPARGGGQHDGHDHMKWQCQVSRPGRVVPHQATATVTDDGLLLQWNHMEALIGKDSLAEAFLTGRDLIAADTILGVTEEKEGSQEASDDALALCVHVLTTPSPINSPEGQSDYNIYRLFSFESSHRPPHSSIHACRDAILVCRTASSRSLRASLLATR